MTKLSVNINKLALLRNSRNKNNPDLSWWGKMILEWGAHGLTVHPRPDGRHIRFDDLPTLIKLVRSLKGREFNIEGYPSDDFLAKVKAIRPDQCTLVPDPPHALTSNAGWDFAQNQRLLQNVCRELQTSGIRVSLFLEPQKFNDEQFAALKTIPCQRIELYTEAFADAFEKAAGFEETIALYRDSVDRVNLLKLGINAGHDLNQKNLTSLLQAIPEIEEVSIGHALTCEALVDGFEKTVKNYLGILS